MKPNAVLALACSTLCAALIMLAAPPSNIGAAATRLQAASGPEMVHIRMGSLIEDSQISAPELAGRGVRASSRFTTSVATQDRLIVFPPAAEERIVHSAHMRVITSAVPFTDTILVTLEVHTHSGGLSRVLTTAPIDIATAPTTAWLSLPLAADTADRRVAPDELLVARVRLNPAAPNSADLAFDIAMALPAILVPSATPTHTPTSTATSTATSTPTATPTPAAQRIWLPLVAR